ncbi:MAG: FAD/NAD(P)-binding protein [Bacillota bacterium]
MSQLNEFKDCLKIAIIGSGPRGMSVLERLVAQLIELDNRNPVKIFLIDDGHVGTGRIWSTTQSPYLLMNTIAQEISAFSGMWDGREPRPGNGPSFAQWWQLYRDDYSKFNGYAPRSYYGEYLLYVLSTIESSLPPHITLYKISARVDVLEEVDSKQLLQLSTGQEFLVDKTVISTGHSINKLNNFEKTLADFASNTTSVTFIEGDSVANMDLSSVKSKHSVGIIGMGLTFYDLIAELTLGRGGRFVTENDGSLNYYPSSKEPYIYAGSRSGMPLPVRGRNQKPFDYEYKPAILTRERALNIRKKGDVYFNRDVLPLLEAEMALVYAETKLRLKENELSARGLREDIIKYNVSSVQDVNKYALEHGVSHPIDMDIYNLAAPFKDLEFPSIASFNKKLYSLLRDDYNEAMRGNVDSPIKAAFDVIRNTRSIVRLFVDFGGLHPYSHQCEFSNKFNAVSSFLSAGPPAFRSLQLQALMKKGIVTFIGPSMTFKPSSSTECIYMYSDKVQNSLISLDVVIDARIPTTDITRDCSKLTQSLINKGTIAPFVNKKGDVKFETGGVNVTSSPFHPIRVDGTVAEGLYILGIPTEHTRWFMQSGSSRPHKWIDFMIDADAIASDILNSYSRIFNKEEKNFLQYS